MVEKSAKKLVNKKEILLHLHKNTQNFTNRPNKIPDKNLPVNTKYVYEIVTIFQNY